MDEAGLPGILRVTGVALRLWAPKGTPKDVISETQFCGDVTALADPTVRTRLGRPQGRKYFRLTSRPRRRLPRSTAGRDREMVADHQGKRCSSRRRCR